MQVDPQFRKSQAAAKRRRAQRQIRLAAIAGGILCGIAVMIGVVVWLTNRPASPDALQAGQPDTDAALFAQVEDDTSVQGIRLATPFTDIAGDPMILRFETSDVSAKRSIAGPATLDAPRFGPARTGRFSLVVEDLVVRESRLMTALPSSREDFAFFQAQRGESLDRQPNLTTLIRDGARQSTEEETVTVTDGDNSWGDALGGADSAAPTTYVNTRIQNTTSIAFVRPESERQRVSRDLVVRLEYPRLLVDLLTSNGFDDDVARKVVAAATDRFPKLAAITTKDGLAAGTIVAVRHRKIDHTPTPLQMTIFGPDGYIGTVARRGLAGYIEGSNPWIQDDLPALASPDADTFKADQDYRLLDAVYSAVIRNEVPTTLVGELIVMLSQSYDLEAVAAPGDKVTLLYAPGRGDGRGQVAYAAINGPSGDMPCYVAQRAVGGGSQEFACFTPGGLRGGGGEFVTPVSGGTLSSPFGPRFHPVLKEVRLHGGVDWAAPTGTPIVAARDGKFAVVGNGGGYGNVVYIDHGDGLQSRYAHMDRFATIAVVGQRVQAGEVIGYVGTTGRSTGPHLHFEFRVNGAPVDPFSIGRGGGSLVASAAVEALTDQIIKVESGGDVNAKNPRSSATGPGQFIDSTWLRMMDDYRPDLVRTLSRNDLLDLRRDYTLSREMVQSLARENENFLRARGHQVDAGRLYLSHFLGPGGAHRALSAPDEHTVLAVMGAGVVRANPFLKDYTIADLEAWAQRKMRGASTRPRRQTVPPEIRAYIETIDTLLAQDI